MYVIEDITSEVSNQEPGTPDLAAELRTVLALRTKGRCRDGHGTLTHLFFSEDLYDIARAKAICAKCPVSALCLDTALEPPGAVGRLGRTAAAERAHRHQQATPGRPPKRPRPELVVDEVPLPPYLATAG